MIKKFFYKIFGTFLPLFHTLLQDNGNDNKRFLDEIANNIRVVNTLTSKFKNSMEINDINAKIALKQKEISLEREQTKKYKLQSELQVLQLKKQIANFNKK